MRITPRIRAVLARSQEGPHTTSQIARLYYHGNRRKAAEALKKLWSAGHINRIVKPFLETTGRPEYLYYAKTKKLPRGLDWIQHALTISEFGVALHHSSVILQHGLLIRQVLVDDRDVVVFKGQMAGDAETDLSGAADDNLHKAVAFSVIARPPWPKNLAGKRASSTCQALLPVFVAHAQGFELAVQGRTLHANEFGRFRYVAAETGHLGHQVFALENFPRVA